MTSTTEAVRSSDRDQLPLQSRMTSSCCRACAISDSVGAWASSIREGSLPWACSRMRTWPAIPAAPGPTAWILQTCNNRHAAELLFLSRDVVGSSSGVLATRWFGGMAVVDRYASTGQDVLQEGDCAPNRQRLHQFVSRIGISRNEGPWIARHEPSHARSEV